jgi:hypothetical protein
MIRKIRFDLNLLTISGLILWGLFFCLKDIQEASWFSMGPAISQTTPLLGLPFLLLPGGSWWKKTSSLFPSKKPKTSKPSNDILAAIVKSLAVAPDFEKPRTHSCRESRK